MDVYEVNLRTVIKTTAGEVRAGDYLVDWHDKDGRGVFDSKPCARRVVEVEVSSGHATITLFDGHRREYMTHRPVEVDRP
jgi:hypothetical protein